MQTQKRFLCNPDKPETLVMLKRASDLPKLIYADPEEISLIWVSYSYDKTMNAIRQKASQCLNQQIYSYNSISQVQKQLKLESPQKKILVVCIKMFIEGVKLEKLKNVEKIFFYSAQEYIEDYIQPLSELQAFIWRRNIFTDSTQLIKKLKQQYKKGYKENVKNLPNVLFLKQEIVTSHILVRTMHSLLNQQIDENTEYEINQRFKKVIQKYQTMIPGLKRLKIKGESQLFFNFLSNKQATDRQIIGWYTDQTFVYKFINNLLRVHRHPEQIFFIQPYFKMLFGAIKKCYDKQSKEQLESNNKVGPIIVYRGGKMQRQEFWRFRNNKKQLIQTLGFLSTSFDEKIAKKFMTNAFFIITIEQQNKNGSQFGYAILSKHGFGRFQEKQMLFNPLNRFEIVEAKQQHGKFIICLNYMSFNSSIGQIGQKNQKQQHQSCWQVIASLQKKQKLANICQGNALINEYYNLHDADLYWNQYLQLVEIRLQIETITIEKMKLMIKKAFGLFNRHYHYFIISSTKQTLSFEIIQSLNILRSILSDENQVVKYLLENIKKILKIQEMQQIENMAILEQIRSQLLKLPQYKYFQTIKFGTTSFIQQKKFLINLTLNLCKFQQYQSQGEDSMKIHTIINGLKEQQKQQLKILNLQNNNLQFHQQDKDIFRQFEQLQELNLSRNNIKCLPSSFLCLQSIITIDLNYNQLGEEGAKMIGQSSFHNLVTLKLSKNVLNFNQLRDNGLKSLCESRLFQNCKLRVLEIRLNQIGPEGVEYLAKSNIKDLTCLDLWGNHIGNDGVRHLAQGELKKLQRLNVGSNKIQNDGAKYLAFDNFQNLSYVQLRENEINKVQQIENMLKAYYKDQLNLYI